MNLSPLSDLVKPDRPALFIALATALVITAAFALIARATDGAQRGMDHFGNGLAATFAALAAEPISQANRLHLAVIGNRLVETAEVRGVASYAAEGQVLATTGDLSRPYYSQPVAVDDNVVGEIRIALRADAFAAADGRRLGGLLAAAVLAALLVACGVTLIRGLRSGELQARIGPLPNWRPAHSTTAEVEAPPEPAPPPPRLRRYLLAANLYNQLTLAGGQREFEQSLGIELAEAVADLYRGQVVTLPGVGLLVDFDDSDDPERPFDVVCAALLLARLLHDESPFGTYRLGLNLTDCPADELLPLDDDAIADAALLSALAKDLTLAISQPFAAALGESRDRLDSQPLINPLLDELTTSNAGCHLICALRPAFAATVDAQLGELRAQRSATSSPSTF